VYSLEAQRTHALLPLPSSPGDASSAVVALAFSPLGDKLVAATAGKDIQLFDLESGKHAWAASVPGAALPERLRQMPGHVCALTMDPSRGVAAVLAHTQHAVCHLDLTRPLTGDAPAPQKRRRVNLVPSAAAVACASKTGSNGRIITLEHPCLFAGYIQPAAALLVERPWDSIMRALPPPLWRHRFGV
jgi:U3 small nucleolar RNA-associated protein 4